MKNILIIGIGGASLGTEIYKSLLLCGEKYKIFGTDISKDAFGHSLDGFEKTFTISTKSYIEDILEISNSYSIDCIIPGGEEPLRLINKSIEIFNKHNIKLAINNEKVIKTCSDKGLTFDVLKRLNIDIPMTIKYKNKESLEGMNFPCIVKPSIGSGGSSFVFFASDQDEAILYCKYLNNNGKKPIIQEYISEEEGEFTIGVLSLPDKTIVGSIALKRAFDSKLSVLIKGDFGLISSGYSQGVIDDFSEIRQCAEDIAKELNSTGPLNIQARLKNGKLIPFEINPRFSASTYLRALAGFNEIDIYLDFIFEGKVSKIKEIQFGRYLRSLSEIYVPLES